MRFLCNANWRRFLVLYGLGWEGVQHGSPDGCRGNWR